MSDAAVIFCSILTGLVGLVGCWGFHPRSRLARVAVLCGFTAFVLAVLSAHLHREWVRGMRHESAVVTQVGKPCRARLVLRGQEVNLWFDQEFRVGEEVEILVDRDDDGRLVAHSFEDQRTAIPRAILFAAASAALFSWGVLRLRRLGPDPGTSPPEPPGTGVNPS